MGYRGTSHSSRSRWALLWGAGALLAAQGPGDEAAARAEGAAAAALLARGDAVFGGDDGRTATWKALGYYREALKLERGDYEALWRAARAFARLADEARVRGEERSAAAFGEKGLLYARRAIRAAPRRVEGHYWAAVCIGEYGNGVGVVSAVRQGILGRFLEHLRAALRLDPSYEDAGADRMLAMYYHTVPWPLRDRQKALFHINRAGLCRAGHNRTLYCRGQILEGLGRRAEAREALRRCAASPGEGGDPVTNRNFQRRCRRLLETVQ